MKFRVGLIAFIVLVAVIGVAAFLFFPKGGAKNGIFFNTYEGVYAKITGSVRGNANSITLSDLTYGEGATPTADELASWQVNLEFGEEDEITITINVENKNTNKLYVIFKDDKQTISNVTKTILNDGRPYISGSIVVLQSDTDTTLFTITFRRDQDVVTNIRYNYHIELKAELSDADIQDGSVEAEENSGYTYTFNGNGTATITGLSTNNQESNLVLPNMVLHNDELYTVTTIGSNAFKNKTTITSVTIPNTVTELKASVFEGCTNLTNVTIPTSVTKLGNNVFKNCSNLITIELPNTITSVGTHLFSDCTKLEQFNIPLMLKKLPDYMFQNCSRIINFDIPNTISSLGNYVFNGCSFNNFTIPDSVGRIADNTFTGIKHITNITVPCNVTRQGYGIFNNVEDIDNIFVVATKKGSEIGNAFAGLSSIGTINIQSGVNSIVAEAMWGCGMQKIIIPNSITSIGNNAFRLCSNLTNVNLPSSITEIEYSLFLGCSSLTSITIPNSVNVIGSHAFKECTSLVSVNIPEGVENIYEQTFANCYNLTSITIPRSITGISNTAFNNCYSLVEVYNLTNRTIIKGDSGNGYLGYYAEDIYTSISQPSKLIKIDGVNYYRNEDNTLKVVNLADKNTTKVELNSNSTEIRGYAFYQCTGLLEIKIPSSVVTIGKNAFSGCMGLTKVTSSSLLSWLNIEFNNNNSNPLYYSHHLFIENEEIVNIQIPDTMTEVKPYTFYGCTSIKTVRIPNSVTSIGEGAFGDCTEITSIIIPESVAVIENSAFGGCYSLAEVYNLSSINISKGSTNNGYVAYYADVIHTDINEASALVEIDGVVYLKKSSDNYIAIKLADKTTTSLNFDYRTTEIKGFAFCGCDKITSVIIPSELTIIGARAFADCTKLSTINFQTNTQLSTIKQEAFSNCISLNSVFIPSTITSIEHGAFSGTTGIIDVTIDSEYVYRSASNATFYYVGWLLNGVKTINVLASIVNNTSNVCQSLNDTSYYTKSVSTITINNKEYYTYTLSSN